MVAAVLLSRTTAEEGEPREHAVRALVYPFPALWSMMSVMVGIVLQCLKIQKNVSAVVYPLVA
jgi:hypothetical protein